MALVVVTYNDLRVKRQEVVDPSSSRFTELVKSGIEEIAIADEGMKLGIARSIKTLGYKNEKEPIQIDITYTTNTGKLKIDDFESFYIRGYEVKRGFSDNGDVLSVDLKKSQFPIIDRQEALNIGYAVKSIQEFNQELINELPVAEEKQSHSEVEAYE
jgi:hypothetical protein